MWQNYLLVLVVAFIFTLQSLFAKLYSDNYTGEARLSSPVFSVLYGFIPALITIASAGFIFSPSRLTVVLGLCNGVFLFVYNYALIEASRRGPFSFVMICNLFGGVLTLLFVMMFFPRIIEALLGRDSSLWFVPQDLKGHQVFALGVVLIAFVLLNLKEETQEKPKKGFYFLSVLLGLVNGGYGCVLALQAALRPSDNAEVLVITFAFGGLLSFGFLFAVSRKKVFSSFKMPPKAWLFAVGACFVATLAANLLTYILKLFENSAIVNATNNGAILIFSALSSLILFKEKMNWKQFVGAGLCVVSIVLLNL